MAASGFLISIRKKNYPDPNMMKKTPAMTLSS